MFLQNVISEVLKNVSSVCYFGGLEESLSMILLQERKEVFPQGFYLENYERPSCSERLSQIHEISI
jgi:hypothetical protein